MLAQNGATGSIVGSTQPGGDLILEGTSHPDTAGSFIKLDAPITYVTQKLDVGDDIPDVASGTTSILDISPTVDTTGGTLNHLLIAPTTVSTGNLNWAGIRLSPALTFTASGLIIETLYGLRMEGTSNVTTANVVTTISLFSHVTAWQSTMAGRPPVDAPIVFDDNGSYTYTPNTVTGTVGSITSFNSRPLVSAPTNGGTLIVTGLDQFIAGGQVSGVAGSTATITTRRGFVFKERALGGTGGTRTVTTQVGLDVEALSGAVTNIGIRNASTTVNTPPTQNITAVTDQITANATLKFLTSNAAYALTSAPTIPIGQLGQMLTLHNGGGFNITLKDERVAAGSKLYLPLVAGVATNMVLNPGDCVTFIGRGADWLCVNWSDNF